MNNLAALLQLSDSAFPSGAFSHSFGLETAIDEGRVVDEASLVEWLRRYLLEGLASLDGGAIALCLRGEASARSLDEVLAASLFSIEQRHAVQRLACAMLDAYAAMDIEDADMRAYARAVSAGEAHGHPAVAFALGARVAALAPRETIVGYASAAVAALGSVAARTVPLGQRATARALWRLRPAIDTCAAIALAATSTDDLRAQAFAAEIDAMRHRRLDGRLFAS